MTRARLSSVKMLRTTENKWKNLTIDQKFCLNIIFEQALNYGLKPTNYIEDFLISDNYTVLFQQFEFDEIVLLFGTVILSDGRSEIFLIDFDIENECLRGWEVHLVPE